MATLSTDRLPVRLVPMVGRLSELDDVAAALARSRLLTLTGPGGTGKSRLALAAAGAAAGQYPGGLCWLDLADVAEPSLLVHELAERLGVADSPLAGPAEAIAAHIGDSATLIVLDNCEHLTEAVAELAELLLHACPALSVLVTSRELLGVEGERSWPVPPLSLPPAGQQPGPHELAAFDAIALFEQRARLVRPSFRLGEDNCRAVLQVCRRLDGLPLAIELAAARVRVLSAGQLAERLDDVFAVLVGGSRSAPQRHQALRATLDWSHDLLDDGERTVFRRLSVFSGGLTLAAAEHVAAGPDIGRGRVLELLSRLVDKSLVGVEHSGGQARYQLLATVREYASERLREAAEDDRVRRAHLDWMVGLVADMEQRIDQAGQQGAGALDRQLDLLEAELPNLRAATEFAREQADPLAGLSLAAPLGRYAYLRGHYHEVRQWLDAAVAAGPGAPAPVRAKALLGSGHLALLQCDYQRAVRRLDAALRIYRDLGDAVGIASALQVLGSVAREQGRYARAMELHAESLAIAEEAAAELAGPAAESGLQPRRPGSSGGWHPGLSTPGGPIPPGQSGAVTMIARARGYLGFAAWLQGDFNRAISECTTALSAFRGLGDIEGTAWSLLSLGVVARYRGDTDRAHKLLTESLSLSESIGFREGIAWSLEQLGLLASGTDHAAAAAMLGQSLELHRALQDWWRTCSVLDDLAALAVPLGDAALAVRLLGAASRQRELIGTVIAPCEQALHDQTETAARAALGDDMFAACWLQGEHAVIDDLQAELAGLTPAGRPPPSGQATAMRPAVQPAARPAEQAVVPAQRGSRSRPQPAAEPHGAAGSGPAADAALHITALGAATVSRGGNLVTAADWGYAKPRELLFLLVSSAPMTREQVGAALWPDLAPQQLGNALHTALRGLRRALGDPEWVQYADGRYVFNAALAHECDVRTFDEAMAAARRAKLTQESLPHLQRAIAVYGGEFLAGMAAGDWAQARRDELHRAFEAALLAAGRLHLAGGRFQAAATAFRRAVAHEPLNETAHRELMGCWARLGESARAVQHYREFAAMLQEQLGVPPSAETTALYQRLTAGS